MYSNKKGSAMEMDYNYTRESDGSSYELYIVAFCSPVVPGNWHHPPEGGEIQAIVVSTKEDTPTIDITDEDEIALSDWIDDDCDWSPLDNYDSDVTGHLLVL